MKKQKHILLILLTITTLSCSRYSNLVYLQDAAQEQPQEHFKATAPDYRIQQRDILFIRILSLNQEVTEVINGGTSETSQMNNEAGLFIYGYNVNDSGYIEIPVIGQVKVEGKTMEEARENIEEKTATHLKNATVVVKLVSFKYSVIGEVAQPGVYQNFNNQLTVLEAIGRAGDINEFGDRRQVMVIRSSVDGTHTYRIDLTQKEIIGSPGFFLLPNDIVYVQPVRSYNFRVNIPSISVFLGAVSTLVLILNFMNVN